ncbi:hypothetical protein [Pedobacter sp. L105]|uniref:hypothetical protein n=1 Tax=Pedobacter sp. L105 TaxID=1641871 RepID=UPI00131C5877|nr:hypothetical protein [Pedobacter sp. L105]
MENETEILVVGTNEKILQVVLRLLRANVLWRATGVSGVDEVLSGCREKVYDVLLIGAGLTDEEEERLSTEVKTIRPAIKVIKHYGGGSGLLFAEIYLALGTKNQAQ